MKIKTEMLDVKDFKICELKGYIQRVERHLPGGEKYSKATRYGNTSVLTAEDGRKIIVNAVLNGKPYMVGRFGTSEGNCLYEYWKKKLLLRNGYTTKCVREMTLNAGFFHSDVASIDRWAELETEACSCVDMLGTMNFLGEEWIYRTFCNNSRLMPAGGIGSASKGWTWCLEGKKILVIHPFTDTIMSQYMQHRTDIFPGSNALPKFDLQCIKAIQTIGGERDSRFSTWFDALDYMSNEAKKKNFDVALIGCGAYGFQLASRIKRMGKIAIHMGGCLQTLFGIKGARWDKVYSNMYNDAWVYPSEEETPKNAYLIENGCYWK